MYIDLERVFSVHRGIRPQYHTDPFSQPPRGILSAAERLGKDHGIRFFVTKVLLDPFLLEPFVSFDTLRGSRRRLLLRGGRLRWEPFLRRPCRRRTAAPVLLSLLILLHLQRREAAEGWQRAGAIDRNQEGEPLRNQSGAA